MVKAQSYAHDALRRIEVTETGRCRTARRAFDANPDALCMALRDSPPSTRPREALCEIIGVQRCGGAIGAVIECLDDPHPAVRYAAAQALRLLKDRSSGVALLSRYERCESNPFTQAMLLLALGNVGHLPSIPALMHALRDPDQLVRSAATVALAQLYGQES